MKKKERLQEHTGFAMDFINETVIQRNRWRSVFLFVGNVLLAAILIFG